MWRKIFSLLVICIAFVGVSNFSEAALIKVEGVGFFNHPPLFGAKDAIIKVCEEFGDKVEFTLYMEDDEDGQQFMKEKNLSGHIPMALFINGSMAHQLGVRTVVFRDFIGRYWTEEDLRQVVEFNVSRTSTAIAAPENAYSGFYKP